MSKLEDGKFLKYFFNILKYFKLNIFSMNNFLYENAQVYIKNINLKNDLNKNLHV